MGEETLVQAAQCVPDAGTDHEAGATAPENVRRMVVLSLIFLYLLQDAAPAEGIAIAVQHTACRSGVLERVALGVGEELGPAGTALGMAVHPFQQGFEPVFGDFYVAVDEDVIIGLYFL